MASKKVKKTKVSGSMEFYVFFSMQDAEGSIKQVPLASFDDKREAEAYRFGYIDAICNHTNDNNKGEAMSLVQITQVNKGKET